MVVRNLDLFHILRLVSLTRVHGDVTTVDRNILLNCISKLVLARALQKLPASAKSVRTQSVVSPCWHGSELTFRLTLITAAHQVVYPLWL